MEGGLLAASFSPATRLRSSFVLCSLMPRDGATTLSDVRQPFLELVCDQCGRTGRYNVAALPAKRGDMRLRDLAPQIADCPKARPASIYDRCKPSRLATKQQDKRKWRMKIAVQVHLAACYMLWRNISCIMAM